MIRLRELQMKDADGMLEWMHDPELMKNFRFDASSMTRQKVEAFIAESLIDEVNKHFAVVDEDDEYLGTISIKDIDPISKNGEYAIAMRKKAIGSGAALKGTKLILAKAFKEWDLEKVYLNVLTENRRAIRFYEKVGFLEEGQFKKHVLAHGSLRDLTWFAIFKEAYNDEGL
ncbi:GNAT family N-acetyltransferase [Neobacillus terrae]|uniref:GNAT family N-acetyltransferase n=1 Tax=Neobacillus terrae TaxID=3034837 RepID=UPI00140D2E3E|nr:GNAT family protein [Neobacillus terrae]NHM30001.1 GNAT family N-acetyltransferase [Neobacillus terrae]